MTDHVVSIDRSTSPTAIIFSPNFNVAAAFIDRPVREGNGDRIAIRTDTQAISYGLLLACVNRFGNALRDMGLNRGDRVLMPITDTPEFLYTFWGAIKAGFVPVPVSTLLKAPEYGFLIDDSQCAAVVHSPELSEVISEARSGTTATPPVLSTGDDGLAGLAAAASAELAPADATPETECFWLYSSGSTGNPKGVVHAHRDMVVTSERYGQGVAGIRPTDTVYCAGKLFFSFGFGGGMTFPLWAGATTVLINQKPTPEAIFAIIERHRPDVFFGVPTLYGQFLQAAKTRKPDMSSIRIALSAGEALPAVILEGVKRTFGFPVLDGLGSTEALHIFISNRIDDCKPGTSGKPIPGYDIRLLDDAGQPVAAGEIGTIWVRGESIASKYWNNPEKTARTMVDGWLNTGDMYYIDSEGYYVNAGRGDDMLKIGGMWCSPIEIEAHLLHHPDVREVAVTGRRDGDGMVKPEAFVVLNQPDKDANEVTACLTAFCKDGLAGYKYPRWFNFVGELPKTATGKIQRFKLRNRN